MFTTQVKSQSLAVGDHSWSIRTIWPRFRPFASVWLWFTAEHSLISISCSFSFVLMSELVLLSKEAIAVNLHLLCISMLISLSLGVVQWSQLSMLITSNSGGDWKSNHGPSRELQPQHTLYKKMRLIVVCVTGSDPCYFASCLWQPETQSVCVDFVQGSFSAFTFGYLSLVCVRSLLLPLTGRCSGGGWMLTRLWSIFARRRKRVACGLTTHGDDADRSGGLFSGF